MLSCEVNNGHAILKCTQLANRSNLCNFDDVWTFQAGGDQFCFEPSYSLLYFLIFLFFLDNAKNVQWTPALKKKKNIWLKTVNMFFASKGRQTMNTLGTVMR